MGVFDASVPYENRHRLRLCCRHIRADMGEVQVRENADKRPYLHGVQTCGSVWVCPVCAAKIQAHRAVEVRQAIDAWLELGGQVLMMGPTVPHTRADSLSGLVSGFTDAMRKFTNGAPMKRLRTAYRLAGSIRALEVTWGRASGWHPHAHMLLFLEEPADLGELKAALFDRWVSAATRAGFDRLSPKAFSLQDGGAVKTYVTKLGAEYQWSAEHELVKANSKTARGDRYSPFDMLGSNLDQSRPELLNLFREYGETFHGKHQLQWSRGLKKQLLGIDGLTDAQLALEGGDFERICAAVVSSDWEIIRRFNLQGDFIQIAHEHGLPGVENMLRHYREKYDGDGQRLERRSP